MLVGLRRTHKFPSPMSDAYEEVGEGGGEEGGLLRIQIRTEACAAAAVTAAGASFRLWSLLPPLDEQQTQPGRKEGRKDGRKESNSG